MKQYTPSELLWKGITTGSIYDLQSALLDGADINEGAPAGTQYRGTPATMYKAQTLPEGISAFEALLICHESWGNDPASGAEFRKACGLVIRGVRKEVFSNPMSNGDTALLAYCRLPELYQKSNIFELVLRRTPKNLLDAQDERGYTSLMHLMQRYRMESFNVLLKAGADPDIRNEEGRNCALIAGKMYSSSHKSHSKPIQFLERAAENGARIDLPDSLGNTLPFLMYNYPLAPFIAAGGDINATNQEGMTLAQKTLKDWNYSRFNEMINAPEVDWRKQIPNPAEFLRDLNKDVAHYDGSIKDIARRLSVYLEAMALEDSTPGINVQEKRSSLRL